jgi:hypothetical protein
MALSRIGTLSFNLLFEVEMDQSPGRGGSVGLGLVLRMRMMEMCEGKRSNPHNACNLTYTSLLPAPFWTSYISFWLLMIPIPITVCNKYCSEKDSLISGSGSSGRCTIPDEALDSSERRRIKGHRCRRNFCRAEDREFEEEMLRHENTG